MFVWRILRTLLIISVGIRRDVSNFVVIWGVACPLLICFVSSRRDVCVYDFTVLWFVPCHLLIIYIDRASEWMPRHTKNVHAHYTGSLSRTSDNLVRRLLTLQNTVETISTILFERCTTFAFGQNSLFLSFIWSSKYTAIIFLSKISGNGHALCFL